MNILCVGDIVGKPGRAALEGLLCGLKKEFSVDAVIVNAENAAGGSGLTPKLADEFFKMGCDCLTLGDHVWDQKEIEEYLNTSANLIRPANFPDGVPGKGWCVKELPSGAKIGVINLLGRVFMRYNVQCPFKTIEEIVERLRKETPVILVDFHAETTSEKIAMGHFMDGKVSAVFGTHTHVQTADEQILPQGTAYITDLGMSGPHDSVIGQNKDVIIKRFLTSMPIRFSVATGGVRLNGIVLDIEEGSGKARNVQRISRGFDYAEAYAPA